MFNKTELLPKFKMAKELSETRKRTESIKSTQRVGGDSVNLQATPAYTAYTSVIDGDAVVFRFRLASSTQDIVFSQFVFSIYQSSLALANQIGGVNSLGFQYKWAHWTDLEEEQNSIYGYRNVEYVWVENHTGSTQDIHLQGRWKYLINSGDATIS